MLFEFELNGRMPAIMSHDNVEGADEVKAWLNSEDGRKVAVKGDDRSPPWGWTIRLYHDGEKVGIPAENLMSALLYAGERTKIKGTNKSYKDLSQSGILIHEEIMPILVPDRPVLMKDIFKFHDAPFAEQSRRVRDLGFALYVKRVPVEKKKHVRVRPRFDEWRCKGTVEIVDPTITPEALGELLEFAGRRAGLMDRRPGAVYPRRPGQFGTFGVTLKRAKGSKAA
jgi:hypothetical protein